MQSEQENIAKIKQSSTLNLHDNKVEMFHMLYVALVLC